MAFKTRLDAVVKIRDRAEESAKLALARSIQKVLEAERALKAAREQAMVIDQGAGTAADWEIRQKARDRALAQIRHAEEAVRAALTAQKAARDAFENAHRKAEGVRRVAEAKREEMMREADRKERREFDEIAAQRHARKGELD